MEPSGRGRRLKGRLFRAIAPQHAPAIGAGKVHPEATVCLFEKRGHHRLTIDPAAANERAIRAYKRVGFRPVGVMRQYERGPNGVGRDGLLMDLLASEFTA